MQDCKCTFHKLATWTRMESTSHDWWRASRDHIAIAGVTIVTSATIIIKSVIYKYQVAAQSSSTWCSWCLCVIVTEISHCCDANVIAIELKIHMTMFVGSRALRTSRDTMRLFLYSLGLVVWIPSFVWAETRHSSTQKELNKRNSDTFCQPGSNSATPMIRGGIKWGNRGSGILDSEGSHR